HVTGVQTCALPISRRHVVGDHGSDGEIDPLLAVLVDLRDTLAATVDFHDTVADVLREPLVAVVRQEPALYGVLERRAGGRHPDSRVRRPLHHREPGLEKDLDRPLPPERVAGDRLNIPPGAGGAWRRFDIGDVDPPVLTRPRLPLPMPNHEQMRPLA